ncbi:MAG TPA: SDR family oxidoreductase [Alphaproteobacteria bacterium]|nr:SDR family oxidoreductase [Alphaproteobacteria bacterium]
MGRVQDKIALITGGAGGICGATAQLLAEEGAQVVVADVADDAGTALAGKIGAAYHHLDVTSEDQWQALIDDIVAEHGRLDVLVNGAGTEGDLSQGSPENTTLDEWRRVHGINLDGTFLGCRAALPVMKRQGTGSIVNLSSMVAFFPTPGSAAYGSSKAGVMHLSRTVALYAARGGNKIRCNSVHPGLIRTRMIDTIFETFGRNQNTSAAEVEKARVKTVPLGEIGDPMDVAYIILYLASDESRYITGSQFQVDGGWHLGTP